MSERTRQAEISEESQRRILDAAEALFASKGYEATSYADIARESGISRGSIPWHFQNKEGLLTAVIERAQLRALRNSHLPASASFKEVMSAVSGGSQDDHLGLMLLTEAMKSDGAVREQFVNYYRRRRQGLKELMDGAGVEDLPSDEKARDALATAISGAVLGLIYQRLLDPEVDLDAAMQALYDLVARAYGW